MPPTLIFFLVLGCAFIFVVGMRRKKTSRPSSAPPTALPPVFLETLGYRDQTHFEDAVRLGQAAGIDTTQSRSHYEDMIAYFGQDAVDAAAHLLRTGEYQAVFPNTHLEDALLKLENDAFRASIMHPTAIVSRPHALTADNDSVATPSIDDRTPVKPEPSGWEAQRILIEKAREEQRRVVAGVHNVRLNTAMHIQYSDALDRVTEAGGGVRNDDKLLPLWSPAQCQAILSDLEIALNNVPMHPMARERLVECIEIVQKRRDMLNARGLT